ncbi:MAG: hypothetical protein M1832_000501 [Thelocarpon impressellum]|nr:MAG: hypothetical protein M1832_000501 [Thelocarpon impressellum]
MSTPTPASDPPSRTSTPNPATSRFTAQNSTAEDLLKSQTVGLVHLSDFRKRRAEALEQKQREAQDRSLGRFTSGGESGTATPSSDGASTPQVPRKKKRKVATGKLSFGIDDGDENGDENGDSSTPPSKQPEAEPTTSRSLTPDDLAPRIASAGPERQKKRSRLGPNASLSVAPKVMTKSALLREVQAREQLRKEFLAMQEAVKATEILLPFVFYDGTNIPGGVCKVKKGDYTWLFLDKARKVGAELGVGGGAGGSGGEKVNSRREWARVGVDDLMLVRGEVIIPHHFDFYYFIVNKTKGPSGAPLFDYSTEAKPATQPPSTSAIDPTTYNPLSESSSKRQPGRTATRPEDDDADDDDDDELEGRDDDPNLTKVVDRRWYERNKHIFPASVWEEFDADKDYSSAIRRDAGGNAFFFL